MGKINTAAMVQMTGTFTRTSEEGYENFLKELNVGFMLRKAAMASTPVMTISETGGNWTMITKTTMKSVELKFRLGGVRGDDDGREEVQHHRHHGGRQPRHQAEGDGCKDVTAERKFTDDGLTITMTCGNVSSKQVYK